ncbi:Thiamine pyrophosphate enzyme, putative [Penicillium digitatum PHI26]|uniref:Thiamine pyrophosphate enzyme, putative n=2 Tax=Penicillium digitatum TaxID=36651 RepID=K9FVG4_PEND2|nr:Thiamine pyrophosphate enzyme, putative [Penicillium digitatum Pd1]EKV12507.1 Thiamine pyrophosphate enzyme, putative [Penicillium digitatum PHI26]EKV16444.1 Thiamine pyrophosphate enzyme, putative [Penicillium digitatum Pd1]
MNSTKPVPPKRKKVDSDDEDERVKDGNLTSAAGNFFEALSEAGVTHCFVNLGSDHPAMLEAMIQAQQAVEVELIAKSLMSAKRPLVVTSYLGRNLQAPALLAELCDKLPITVVEMVGSDVSLRSDHEAYRGVTVTTHPEILEADVILILDCDVPWIPTAGKPRKGTKVFHLDVDPLKQQMPLFLINATRKFKVGCGIALGQINAFLDKQDIDRAKYTLQFEERSKDYKIWRETLKMAESPSKDGVVSVPYLASRLRDSLPEGTTYVLEAVTNAGHLIHHLNLTKPGSLIASGAGGLGWGGGAALGVKLGKPGSFICAMHMESVYWIARRYDIPFLLIVLNNGGWNAPKVSALLVHKDGLSSKSNRRDLNISFDPSPDYPGIAAAAGKAWGKTVSTQSELDPAINKAADVVQGGKCAVIEVSVPSMWKEN